MSRTVEWSVWQSRRLETARSSARLAERLSDSRRTGSARTRNDDDVAIITRMMRVELDRRQAEGRLVRLGPRAYELHPRTR